jgi:hypothetical protein
VILFRRGIFVDCLFPFAERPVEPGPMRHIAYIYGRVRKATSEERVIAMFTTTSSKMAQKIPEGLAIGISQESSAALGMRNSFVIDIHRYAVLPMTAEWFPDLGLEERFVIGRADDRLRAAIERRFNEMKQRYPNPALKLGLEEMFGVARSDDGVSAARSQDFLYDDEGLPH